MLLAPQATEAQDAQARSQLEQRVRRAFADRLRTELELSTDQISGLERVMAWSDEQRRSVALDNRQVQLDTERFLTEQGDDQDAQRILDGRRLLQQREAQLFEEEQRRLGDVLTPGQIVRFYQLRERFVRRVQELRQNRRGGGR